MPGTAGGPSNPLFWRVATPLVGASMDGPPYPCPDDNEVGGGLRNRREFLWPGVGSRGRFARGSQLQPPPLSSPLSPHALGGFGFPGAPRLPALVAGGHPGLLPNGGRPCRRGGPPPRFPDPPSRRGRDQALASFV